MKRVASVVLALLAGILFPILIWVALFVAIREPLLQGMRRVVSVLLALLAGILFPILIWVGSVVAIRGLLLQWWVRKSALKPATIRQRGFGALTRVQSVVAALLAAILMPVLIWVALFVAIRELLARWRESRLPSMLVCRVNTDCPPGFMCIAGRCVPQY